MKIDIHEQLYKWRQVIVEKGYSTPSKKAGMTMMNWTLSSPGIFGMAGRTGRWLMRAMPFLVKNSMNPWFKQRDMPEAPKQSFTDWYRKNKTKHD